MPLIQFIEDRAPELRAVYQDVKKEHDLMRKKQREKASGRGNGG